MRSLRLNQSPPEIVHARYFGSSQLLVAQHTRDGISCETLGVGHHRDSAGPNLSNELLGTLRQAMQHNLAAGAPAVPYPACMASVSAMLQHVAHAPAAAATKESPAVQPLASWPMIVSQTSPCPTRPPLKSQRSGYSSSRAAPAACMPQHLLPVPFSSAHAKERLRRHLNAGELLPRMQPVVSDPNLLTAFPRPWDMEVPAGDLAAMDLSDNRPALHHGMAAFLTRVLGAPKLPEYSRSVVEGTSAHTLAPGGAIAVCDEPTKSAAALASSDILLAHSAGNVPGGAARMPPCGMLWLPRARAVL